MYLTKVPNSADKKSIFYIKNYPNFFSLKTIGLGAHFLLLTFFFENFNFESTLLSKIMSFLTLVRDMKMP